MSLDTEPGLKTKIIRRILFGKPRDLEDRKLIHRIALAPLLAWVGLGADGLSSSAYGPDEAFRTLGAHGYLAIPLALLVTLTIFVLCMCYGRLIYYFPQGGGGYGVASALLGKGVGVIAGSALLIDYVLTITVSIAAAGAALFSFLPAEALPFKIVFETLAILLLVLLNIRGVRESVMMLVPVFILFALTHLAMFAAALFLHWSSMGATASYVVQGFDTGLSTLGAGGLTLVLLHAYSLGGGTYTGIEAVSNGLPLMREPRVQTANRTLLYMGVSLAFVATSLLVFYLLWNVSPVPGKTMNAVLFEAVAQGMPSGEMFVVLTLLSEGALLVIAAQTGFIGGPRVLANLALDSWVPRRFGALSERLTTHNGIILMGVASLAALFYTGGDVRQLVVMYSINVFITSTLAMWGMTRLTLHSRTREPHRWLRHTFLFAIGTLMCGSILLLLIIEKFSEGGWLTLFVTGGFAVLCFVVRHKYDAVQQKLDQQLPTDIAIAHPERIHTTPPPNPDQPTAGILVASYGGLGIHTMLNVFRAFPGHYKNLVFISVGIVDAGDFKGAFAAEALREKQEAMLQRYVDLARSLGIPATYRYDIGTEIVEEATNLCVKIAQEFPRITFFSGKVIFTNEGWFDRVLHNQTAFAIQRRLHWADRIMVVMPVRIR
jgi:amino acid transporter